jgi:RpiB/LacA/LacB family sugar-phosphate isomerase
MRIVLGCDHNGVAFKEALKKYLAERGHECIDVGSHGEERVDYPDYGFAAAEKVAHGEADRGILICGSGIGMSIVANKVRGVRAALCCDEEAARLSRRHNDANVLTLAAWQTEDDAVYRIVDAFLESEFEGGRHERRVNKIIAYESREGRS